MTFLYGIRALVVSKIMFCWPFIIACDVAPTTVDDDTAWVTSLCATYCLEFIVTKRISGKEDGGVRRTRFIFLKHTCIYHIHRIHNISSSNRVHCMIIYIKTFLHIRHIYDTYSLTMEYFVWILYYIFTSIFSEHQRICTNIERKSTVIL